MDVSVIIVSFNTSDLLRETLAAALQGRGDLKTEIVVVDNHSSDGSADMVRLEFPGARLIANDSNLGFARGVNQGICGSSGRYLLILNADAQLPETGLSDLVRFADEAFLREHAGLVGVRLLNADGSLQYSKGRFPTLARTLTDVFRQKDRRKYSFQGYDTPCTTDWVTGACVLIRREMLEEVGLLDETFFLYYEDVDLCWRAKACGWNVVFYPGFEVRHRNPYARRTEALEFVPVEIRRSHLYFYRKNYSAVSFSTLWLMTLAWAAGGLATTKVPFLGWNGQAEREGRIRARVIREVLFNGRNGKAPHMPADAG